LAIVVGVPEGDTVHRTASALGAWLGGRRLSAVTSRVPGLVGSALVGRRVLGVRAEGKHLFIELSSLEPPSDEPPSVGPPAVEEASVAPLRLVSATLSGSGPNHEVGVEERVDLVLHVHHRMTGLWYVGPVGASWRRRPEQARLVLASGDHLAACFAAPVIELCPPPAAGRVRDGLGPDLSQEIHVPAVAARLAGLAGGRPIGEVLLDQRVVAGVGNIYRSEVLFLSRIHPQAPLGRLRPAEIEEVIATAHRLLSAHRRRERGFARDFGAGPARPFVYRRAGRPCRRCRSRIVFDRLGADARGVWFCPTCQTRGAPQATGATRSAASASGRDPTSGGRGPTVGDSGA